MSDRRIPSPWCAYGRYEVREFVKGNARCARAAGTRLSRRPGSLRPGTLWALRGGPGVTWVGTLLPQGQARMVDVMRAQVKASLRQEAALTEANELSGRRWRRSIERLRRSRPRTTSEPVWPRGLGFSHGPGYLPKGGMLKYCCKGILLCPKSTPTVILERCSPKCR